MGLRKSLRKFDRRVRKEGRRLDKNIRNEIPGGYATLAAGGGLLGSGGLAGLAVTPKSLGGLGLLSGQDAGSGAGDAGFGTLPESQQGLLNNVFGQANTLAGQATNIDPRLEKTVSNLENFQNPGLDQLGKVVAGDYLNANPYLDATFNQASKGVTKAYNDVVIPGITSRFGLSGRSGSPAEAYGVSGAQQNLGDSLSGLATQIYGGNYANERQLQQQASGLLPAFNLDLLNQQYAKRSGLGNLPYDRLGTLARIGGANSAYGTGGGGGGGQNDIAAGLSNLTSLVQLGGLLAGM